MAEPQIPQPPAPWYNSDTMHRYLSAIAGALVFLTGLVTYLQQHVTPVVQTQPVAVVAPAAPTPAPVVVTQPAPEITPDMIRAWLAKQEKAGK